MRIAALTPGATSLVFAGSVLVSLSNGFQITQTPQAKSPPTQPSFHVSVNLVQVDAVVTDSKGNHIIDLRPDDFELTDDGKLQKITYFSWIDLKMPHASRTEAPGPGRSLQKDDVRRSIVLMIDDSGPWAEQDVLPVMAAARRFVAGQVLPGDLVSVTASRGGMGFYQQFTSDKQQLYAAIDRLAHRPGFGLWTVETPTMKKLDAEGNTVPIGLARGEPSYNFRGGDPPNPIGYLRWAIQGLQNIPGRKAVVLFSHSFAAPQSLVDLANRAGVVIYVIDPHGVDPGGRTIPSDATYRKLAKETGGLFLLSSPGANLNDDLGKVLEDLNGYYLIGYQAERNDLELSGGRSVRHDIQLKVRRKNLTVRARHGSIGLPEATAAARVPHSSDEYLQPALFSSFNAGNIRLSLDATYAASVPDPRTALRRPILHAMLVADGRDLQFTDTNDGMKHFVFSVLIAVFNRDATPYLTRERTFMLDLTPAEVEGIAASGIRSVMDVDLNRAGQYQVRAAVRDENSGAMGSAYSFVDAPDFNRPQIALSRIKLSGPEGILYAGGSGGWDRYLAGASVQFECEVFGFRTSLQPPREPRVDMEIRLFPDGEDKPVVDSQVLHVPISTLAENYLGGSLRIGSDFKPGDYTLQLLAYDRLAAPKKQIDVQWTHLTVVKRVTR
ncbi:MAG: VWA domain-containing protein [Acidobacteriia bacterium]|nr:VWA domain-containing protein [Terriglobia bacterium]